MSTARPSPLRRLMLWVFAPLFCVLLLSALANVSVLRAGSDRTRATLAELDDAPVAIVLGAAARADGTPSHALEDRLVQAVELYRTQKVGKLLLSGDHGEKRYDETNCMKRYALEHGVAPEDIFCDHAGFSTHATMARARSVFGVSRAIVVTQRFHLARALYTARELGIEAQGVPCDRRTYRKGPWFELRELGSRTKACVQASWLWPEPEHGGPTFSIEGDGRASWDRPD